MKKLILMIVSCLIVLGTLGCDNLTSEKILPSVLVRILEQDNTPGGWYVGNLQEPILTNTVGHIVLTRFVGIDSSNEVNEALVERKESDMVLDGLYTISIIGPKGSIHLYGTATEGERYNVVRSNYFDLIIDDAAQTLLTSLSIPAE